MTPWPFILADAASACLVFLISRQLTSTPLSQCSGGDVAPSMAAYICLCNPLTVLTCSALSLAGLVQAAMMLAVYGAVVQRSPTIAALGLALASYLDIYSSVFCLPVLSILLSGAEVMAEQPCRHCLEQASAPVDVSVKLNRRQCHHCTGKIECADLQKEVTVAPPCHTIVQFVAVLLLCAIVLVLLSDVTVLSWSGGYCMAWLQADSIGPLGDPQESTGHIGCFAWIKKVRHSTELQVVAFWFPR